MESVWSVMVSLFLVLDPLGNVPIIVSMLRNFKEKQRRNIILRESIFALFIMVAFLFFGSTILKLMGVGEQSLSMAGGVVLFLIGLHMSFPTKGGFLGEENIEREPFVVPMAVPLIAGPGVLGMVMLTVKRMENSLECLFALLVAWAVCTVILLLSNTLSRIMGVRGMEAIQRLMGLALTAMAVHMFMTGFKTFMNS